MHPSNLQLMRYFLTRFDFAADPEYDPDRELQLRFEDLSVETSIAPLNEATRRNWEVSLSLQFSAADGRNVPYALSAEIVGIFTVCGEVPADKVEALVDTNATSVLYSTLREIATTMTAKGPFSPLLLPTVSFYEPEKPADARTGKAKASKKTSARSGAKSPTGKKDEAAGKAR